MIEPELDTRTAARRNGDISPKMGSDLSFPITVFAFPQHWCYDKPTAERHQERRIPPIGAAWVDEPKSPRPTHRRGLS